MQSMGIPSPKHRALPPRYPKKEHDHSDDHNDNTHANNHHPGQSCAKVITFGIHKTIHQKKIEKIKDTYLTDIRKSISDQQIQVFNTLLESGKEIDIN